MGNLEPLFNGKSGTPVYIWTKIGTIVPGHKMKLFCPCELQKNVASFGGVTEVFFSLRNPKNHYFAQAIFWAVRSPTIRHWHGWHVRWCYWGFNILDWLPSAKEGGSRSQRRLKSAIFVLFDPFGPQLVLITTKTGTDLEHYVTCIDSPVNFYNGLY